ncbi:MAG: hypothetical protein ORN27_06810 [Rhodoluna sp.]|nr:hypothetical protein [Rhodoluna sp.]
MNVIRPRLARYAVIGTSAISLSAIVSALVAGNLKQLPSLLVVLGFFGVAVWLFFVEPRITFDENQIVVRNPLRVFKADWAAVKGFETRYGLTILWSGRKFVAWSAPSPSRLQARRIDKHELKGTDLQGLEYIEPGRTPNSASGEALLQLEVARAASKNVKADATVTMNWYGVAGLVAVCALGYLALH